MSIKKAANKQQGESQAKDEESKKTGTDYHFPKYNIIINANSPEEARKELQKKLGKADDGDEQS